MAINVTNAMQTALLQSMSGNAVNASMDTAGSFGAMLMDAMLEARSEEDGAGSALGMSSMFGDNPAYSLMTMMLGSGSDSSTSMMVMSLCNALQKESSPLEFAGLYSNAYAGANTRISAGKGIIPSQPGKPTDPAIVSNVYDRSASRYTAVINQFSVETQERYQPDGGTYCNIFVWDVTTAMGAEIPHYYNAKTGEPMSYGDKGANQMNANGMYKWLHEHGDQYGWFEVTPNEAQELANDGHPVVTALYKSGAHGHVQVVCPSKDGVYDEKRGVTCAQAGRRLTSYRPITQLYSRTNLPKVSYFAHM